MPYHKVPWAENLWYRTRGLPSHPAVLLLHGFTGSSESFSSLMDRLAADYFLIVPDLPGHGRSSAPDNPEHMTMPHTAVDILTLMDQLERSRFSILGYSMGGRLALHIAVQAPSRIRSLILESASPGIRDSKEREARRTRDDRLADEIEDKGLPWFIPYWMEQPLFNSQALLPPGLLDTEQAIRKSQSARGLAQSLRGAGTGHQGSLWNNLTDLFCPTLLITGELDQKFVKIGQDMQENLPCSRQEVVPKAGHTVHLEAPESFFRIVWQFLQSIDLQESRRENDVD